MFPFWEKLPMKRAAGGVDGCGACVADEISQPIDIITTKVVSQTLNGD
jgi:hypothetical protein